MSDALARLDIEGSKDWRGPDVLAVPRPVCPPKPAAPRPHTACRIFIGCGFSFCDGCGGNDFYDIPFTCKPAKEPSNETGA